MVRVLILYSKRSCLSDSPNKVYVIYMILFIVVMWHRVDESTQKTPFFI